MTQEKKLSVLIAGGGTGGHIIPALAVARVLREQHGAEIMFVGTARGLESKLVPEAGFGLRLIDVGQFNNVSILTRLKTMLGLPLSVLECGRILREAKADVVLGVGGYASWPMMAAAILRGVPTMAFEPNAVPGLANRIVGKRVKRAAVNFAEAARWFNNAEVAGIPVRPEFFALAEPPEEPKHLLVFGGSQGARILNRTLPKIARELLERVPGLTILHQAGARHAEATQAAYEQAGVDFARVTVAAFLDDMPKRFERANLVLARGGASTVAELAAAGKPSLIIPFAAAADGHQLRNAEAMRGAGAAELVEEHELGDLKALALKSITEKLVLLLGDSARLRAMGAAARTMAHKDAAERIATMLVEICR